MYTITSVATISESALPQDLRYEARPADGDLCYRVHIEGSAMPVHVLLCPSSNRAGVAWGGDATWIDYNPGTETVRDAVNIVLNDADETARRY